MRPLLLWDIDGTLLRGNRHIAQLFTRALREVYPLPDELQRIEFGGKTDGQIALELLTLHAIDETHAREHLERWSAHYRTLVESVAHELHHSLRMLPGVVPALEALRDHGAIQTLLTGNIEAVAALKLQGLELHPFFDLAIGAYGSDDHDRTRLVPVAERKAAERYGAAVGPTVVIGDTPRDIACGRAGGARTIAVATGSYTAAQLAEHNPDMVLPDLRDTSAVVAAILGR